MTTGCIIDPRPGYLIGKSFKGEVSKMKSKTRGMVVLLALTAASLWAQGDRGIITGTVTDARGAAAPRAMVTATHVATNTSYTTSNTASGDLIAPSLPVGA